MQNTIYLTSGMDKAAFESQLSQVAELAFQAQQIIEQMQCDDLYSINSGFTKIISDMENIKVRQYEQSEERFYGLNGYEQFNYGA